MSNTDDASQVDANTLMNCISRGGETGMLARAELMRRLSTQPPLPEASGDAELREAFAALANVILSEAPADADNIVLFTDCSGKAHTISMDQLRAATALSRPEAGGKEAAEGDSKDLLPESAMSDMTRVLLSRPARPGVSTARVDVDRNRHVALRNLEKSGLREPEAGGECSCGEVYGEDPNCPAHGIGTEWDKDNPLWL